MYTNWSFLKQDRHIHVLILYNLLCWHIEVKIIILLFILQNKPKESAKLMNLMQFLKAGLLQILLYHQVKNWYANIHFALQTKPMERQKNS